AQESPAAQQQPTQPQYRMHVTSELVLVNVVVRDRKGNLVRDLKKEDFSVAEDGKRQDISTFDFENVDALATTGGADATVTGAAGTSHLLKNTSQPGMGARGRRLMRRCFYFSGMDAEHIRRGVCSAERFAPTNIYHAD